MLDLRQRPVALPRRIGCQAQCCARRRGNVVAPARKTCHQPQGFPGRHQLGSAARHCTSRWRQRVASPQAAPPCHSGSTPMCSEHIDAIGQRNNSLAERSKAFWRKEYRAGKIGSPCSPPSACRTSTPASSYKGVRARLWVELAGIRE